MTAWRRRMLLRGARLYDAAAFIDDGLALETWGLSSTIGSTLEAHAWGYLLAVVLPKQR